MLRFMTDSFDRLNPPPPIGQVFYHPAFYPTVDSTWQLCVASGSRFKLYFLEFLKILWAHFTIFRIAGKNSITGETHHCRLRTARVSGLNNKQLLTIAIIGDVRPTIGQITETFVQNTALNKNNSALLAWVPQQNRARNVMASPSGWGMTLRETQNWSSPSQLSHKPPNTPFLSAGIYNK